MGILMLILFNYYYFLILIHLPANYLTHNMQWIEEWVFKQSGL